MAMNFIAGYVLGSRGASRAAGLAASAAQFQARSSVNRTEDLVDRVDRLTLVVQAMWALLEEDGRTQDDLLAKIQELDAADGTEDGKRTPLPRTCPGCQAKVGHGLSVCQFCGTEMGTDDPFV